IEAGIAEEGLHSVRAIPLVENIFVAEHVNLLRRIRPHRPVDDVDPVGAKVSHGAATEIPEPAPAVEFFFSECLRWSVPEPLLPIESLRIDRLVGRRRLIVLPPIGADLRDAADASTLNEIHGVAEMAPTALLHAALQDAFVGTDSAD